MRYSIPTPTVAVLLAVLAGPCTAGGAADKLICDGVIGNSGEQGRTLVRFAGAEARGMGVVYDRFGSLWDRGGKGVLNRYAPDGRALASYRISPQIGRTDKLTLVGDTLVLLIGRTLFTLDVAAKGQAELKELSVRAERISFGSVSGRIACIDTERRLFLLDPVRGERQDVVSLASLKRVGALELGPDGTIYVQDESTLRKVVGDRLVERWGPSAPGERAQLLGGVWFGHGWHGTIKRFGGDLQPDPGVVLGGASGHFIGHLPQNSELVNGRGMARLGVNLYAVSGIGGVMHLLAWQDELRKMRIVRRIGAMPAVSGLGLDRQGRIWALAGSWEWSDRPDSPMRFGVNAPESPGIGQAVMLDGDAMVAPGMLWGTPTFYAGTFEREVDPRRTDKGTCSLRKGFVGSAVYKRGGRLVVLVTDAKGGAQAFHIGADGRFLGNAGEVELNTAAPVARWTTLAMKGADVLLAAGDGYVIEFARDGENWKEARRWNAWGTGPEAAFGAAITLAADAGRLWVSDSERHRAVCLDMSTRKLLATFGTADRKGDDLSSLSTPRTLAARGRRAVVFDSDNQRLVKLRLP